MTTLTLNLTKIQSNLSEEINDLRMRVEKCEIQGDKNSKEIKILEKKCTTELSRFYFKEEEKIPYVFTAPPRNRYFAGRTEEIQELKRILKVEETSKEKKVRVAAVCGLGGIGKTSLVSEYAHQMKDFYKGGVYWFSAEDDAHLSKTVNAVAVKIGALLNSFDLTLPNILQKISTVHDPCLIILDCLDQLDLSPNVMEFLSFPSQENIFGHFIVLTRRKPKRLVNEISVVEEDFCLQLKCLHPEEAKQFLFSRTNVIRDENVESAAECLCEELGRLPLALEQAGAFIQTRGCRLSLYLEQYKAERLQLLSRQQALAAGNDSSERLAVHTTWLINMEYMKKSPDGQAAVRFMNACSFFDGNEVQEELINIGTPEVEDVAYRKCVSSPLGCREILKLLTDFSLFTYVEANCVGTHRLVQELVWENLDPKSKAESFIDAVRLLSYAFSKCPSPIDHVSLDERNSEEENISFSDPPDSPSHFYMWSKLCMHAHRLRRNAEDLLVSLDSVHLDSVWFPETAKILYECAVHLSANHQQEEAKRTLNFAYRMLDWLPLAGYETVEKNVSDDFLFPLRVPLPELFQMMIQRFCIPTFNLLESLTEKPTPDASDLVPNASDLVPEASDLAPEASDLAPEASDLAPDAVHHTPDADDFAPEARDLVPDASDLAPDASELFLDPSDLAREASDLSREAGDLAREAIDLDLDKKIDKFDLDGNKAFKEGFFEEALDAYSSTINLAQDCNKPFDPLLLTKRSMVYIKLEEWENALKDANDYITRRPYCWRGYALKALALDGLNKAVSANLNDKASAEIAAALAFYHNRGIFTDFPIFVESFPDLQRRIFICDSVDELFDAMFSQEVETDLLKILVLGSEEYILNCSETVEKPWNNCILVGTRKNCCVSLTSNYDIFLLKCMLTNLSFRFNECRLHCLPDSFVKILNCNFTSYDDKRTIKTEGVFNAKQCSFTRSPLVCSKQSRADVDDCSFCNNAKDGLRVEKGGTLKVENCRIYNNGGYGLFVDKSECVVVINCDIHDNGHDGIRLYRSENVTLVRNNVYNNNMSGICMDRSLSHVRENNLLDNGTWGIWVESFVQCNISMNKIFRNKTGGVRMYLKVERKRFSPSVIELNKICHNGGPGLLVDDEINKVAESLHLNSPNSFQSVKFQNNEVYQNKENENDSKLNLSVPYCSYCRVKCKPTMCEKCFTTAYCSESCQEQHYSKHKEICKVLREKSSYLITSTVEADECEIERVEGSKEVGPEFSAPPPRDGRRFVVKVHTGVRYTGSYAVIVHDRSVNPLVTFSSKVVDQLLKEFGVLCEGNVHEKKLFFHCLFEDNGQLRLFMNEFAEFENW
ncbi:Stress-induced-phospho 1 [Paramuricea clavata]|uniref:Stress-induced-phospho 1 n=1 Tax=Paramuricea clavata TaxID=317549 RepID=A0A6S7K3T4_PARCT|nr:Stress-induced-phospho 1 [Paramuricea clavata]